jgi:hypothetical protein
MLKERTSFSALVPSPIIYASARGVLFWQFEVKLRISRVLSLRKFIVNYTSLFSLGIYYIYSK